MGSIRYFNSIQNNTKFNLWNIENMQYLLIMDLIKCIIICSCAITTAINPTIQLLLNLKFLE